MYIVVVAYQASAVKEELQRCSSVSNKSRKEVKEMENRV